MVKASLEAPLQGGRSGRPLCLSCQLPLGLWWFWTGDRDVVAKAQFQTMRSTSLKRPYNLILLTYLEFIFINDLRWESSFISSPTDSLLCSHYLLNKSLFFHWVEIPHFHIQNSPIKWDLFQNCPSVLWSLQLSLCPDHIDLLWWLFSALIPSKVDAFLLCFFLHVPWLFTGIFFLHLKFKIIILNYPPKAFIGILSGIALMYS